MFIMGLYRYDDPKITSDIFFAGYTNFSIVYTHQFFGKCEPDSGALRTYIVLRL